MKKTATLLLSFLAGCFLFTMALVPISAADEFELEVAPALPDLSGIWNVAENYDCCGEFQSTWVITFKIETEKKIKYFVTATRSAVRLTEEGKTIQRKIDNRSKVVHVCYDYPACGECKYKYKGFPTASIFNGSVVYKCKDGYTTSGTFAATKVLGTFSEDAGEGLNPVE